MSYNHCQNLLNSGARYYWCKHIPGNDFFSRCFRCVIGHDSHEMSCPLKTTFDNIVCKIRWVFYLQKFEPTSNLGLHTYCPPTTKKLTFPSSRV